SFEMYTSTANEYSTFVHSMKQTKLSGSTTLQPALSNVPYHPRNNIRFTTPNSSKQAHLPCPVVVILTPLYLEPLVFLACYS
ncbi:hypothetical protein J6590_103977, partial [Homalodisca vitripennis]